MVYTLTELSAMLSQTLKKLEAIDKVLKNLPTAYASKLQWKQLDNIRNSDIEDLKAQVADLQSRLDALTSPE